MKKRFLLTTASVVILILLCIFISDISSDVRELKRYFDITEHQYEKNESVFKNNLNTFSDSSNNSIKISKFLNSFWIIEGERYNLQKTAFNISDPTVNWKVDLSALSPCGACDDIKLYSSTGKCDNEVLIAVENGEYFLLTSTNVLSPYQYSYDDFLVVEPTDETASDNLDIIWEDHLSGEYNIQYLLMEDDSGLKTVEMHIQGHPELIYSFYCYEYNGDYYSQLPFDETSNGYYDITERVKEGKQAIERSNLSQS